MVAKRVDSWVVTDDFWQRVEPLIPRREQARRGTAPQACAARVLGHRVCTAHGLPVEGAAQGAFWQCQRDPQEISRMGGDRCVPGVMEGGSCRVRPDAGHCVDLAKHRRVHAQGASGTRSGRAEPDRSGEKMEASATCWWTSVASRCRSSWPAPNGMMSRSLRLCSRPSWSGVNGRCARPNTSPQMRDIAVGVLCRATKRMATSLMWLIAVKRRTSSAAIRSKKPDAGLSKYDTDGSTDFASCCCATRSSNAASSHSTTSLRRSSRSEKCHLRSILFTDKFIMCLRYSYYDFIA